MIRDFEARFDAAYDLRLYAQAKGYVDASSDEWEYLTWEPQDPDDVEGAVGEYWATFDDTEEF